jgi:hypothetical protein
MFLCDDHAPPVDNPPGKTIIMHAELSKSPSEYFKPLRGPCGGFTSETAVTWPFNKD